jgi:hypothetical protein
VGLPAKVRRVGLVCRGGGIGVIASDMEAGIACFLTLDAAVKADGKLITYYEHKFGNESWCLHRVSFETEAKT